MQGARVVIVGGGVAGLAAAGFLRQAGFEVVVCEGRDGPADDAGAFLNLAPNGTAVLAQLGVLDRVAEVGFPCPRLVFHNARGRRIGEVRQRSTVAARGGGPGSLLLKRGDLVAALRGEAWDLGAELRFGARLVGVEVRADGVRARFADGTDAEGDILLGCDGIWSRTRRLVLPGSPAPRFTGMIDLAGFARAPSLPPTGDAIHMTFGKRAFFGWFVTPDGESWWFSNQPHPAVPARGELEAGPDAGWRERLLRSHGEDHAPIADIIRSTDTIGRFALYELPTLPRWHDGPVCLLGDAAHAALPHAGQGASTALEDAAEIVRSLCEAPSPAAAFAAFETRRRPRVERIAAFARRTGRHKAVANPLAAALRDAILPFFLRRGAVEARWIYDYRVDRGEAAAPAPAAGVAA